MIMFDLYGYLENTSQRIEALFQEILPDDGSRIVKAMRHSMLSGGKRIRPGLCIAASEAVGGKADDVFQAACAIEMIHTYSLIHDDLPAMDDDELRRGRPTCHIAFDEATAILAGDALLTLAFETLSAIGCAGSKYAHKEIAAVIRMIAGAAGFKGMIGGQMKDIASEGVILEPADLQEMHAMKTGALIEAAVFSGSVLGGGTIEQTQALTNYARRIGLAFQIADDLLNVEGDPALLGKAVGTDEKRRKSTYPGVMGMEKAKHFAENMVEQALENLETFDERAEPLRAIATFIIERKH